MQTSAFSNAPILTQSNSVASMSRANRIVTPGNESTTVAHDVASLQNALALANISPQSIIFSNFSNNSGVDSFSKILRLGAATLGGNNRALIVNPFSSVRPEILSAGLNPTSLPEIFLNSQQSLSQLPKVNSSLSQAHVISPISATPMALTPFMESGLDNLQAVPKDEFNNNELVWRLLKGALGAFLVKGFPTPPSSPPHLNPFGALNSLSEKPSQVDPAPAAVETSEIPETPDT